MTEISAGRILKKISQENIVSIFQETIGEIIYVFKREVLEHIGINKNNIDRVVCNDVTVDVSADPVINKILFSLLLENYEQEETEFVSEYIRSGSDLIGLGAGLGYLSCYANIRMNPQTHIVVEPNPNLRHIVRKNKKLNDADFKLIEKAYSSKLEPVTLAPGTSCLGSRTSKTDGTIDIRPINIESIIDQYDIGIFSLVVDIEGSELDLLTNELRLLEERCELMIVEFHDQKTEFRDIWQRTDEVRNRLKKSVFIQRNQLNGVAVFENTKLS